MNSVNLCDVPWIPVAGESGRKSLVQLFSEPSLRRLSGNAVDKIVILRFLLCVVHAACPLPDEEAWRRLTPEKLSAAVLAYLKDHHDCFYLHGERPFLQFPRLAERGKDQSIPISALLFNFSDNKTIVSEWDGQNELTEAELIVALLRFCCFGLGRNGYKPELFLQSNINKSPVGKSGTLLGQFGYLHSYLLGDTLIKTLHNNLLTDKEIHDIGIASVGQPFWENMPQGEMDQRALEYRASYQGILFPIDKFVFLQDDSMIRTDGIFYGSTDKGALSNQLLCDPALTLNEKGDRVVNISTSRRPFRDLPSILSFLDSQKRERPFLLRFGYAKNRDPFVTFWCAGVEVSFKCGNNISGKNDFVESEFYLPRGYDGGEGFGKYKDLMAKTESAEKLLKKAIRTYWEIMTTDNGQKASPFCRERQEDGAFKFWERLEMRAQTILDLAFSDAGDEEIQQEINKWFAILCRVYDEICPHQTPRQMAAWVEARPGFQHQKEDKEVR